MKQVCVAIIILMFFSINANINGCGQESFGYTGNDLYEDLISESEWQLWRGIGYISGIVDALDEVYFSISIGVQVIQVRDVIVKYLEEYPEKRHERAVLLVTEALKKAFPKKET